MREEHRESINKQWDEIQAKMDELQELRKKLNCSLAIQELWPDAFDTGPVKSYFVGNMREKIRDMKFRIESGIRMREFNIFEIPEILLDRQIQIQIDRTESTRDKKIWLKFKLEVYRIKHYLTRHK